MRNQHSQLNLMRSMSAPSLQNQHQAFLSPVKSGFPNPSLQINTHSSGLFENRHHEMHRPPSSPGYDTLTKMR